MTTRRIVPAIAVALFVLIAAGTPVSAEQVLLRHKFFPPRDLVYDFWASGTATISGSALPTPAQQQKPSGRQVLQQTANGRLVARIESVDSDGNGTVTLKLGRLGIEMSAMEQSTHVTLAPAQGTIEADGEVMALAELQQILRWLEACKLTISPRGKALAISAPGPVPIQPPRGGLLPLMLRPERWEKLLATTPAWLPQRPVQIGDRWGMNVAIPIPGCFAAQPADISVRYTLERIGQIDGNRIARIGFEGGIAQSGISVPVPRGPMRGPAARNLQLTLDEKLSGQLYFNLDSGQLHSARGDITTTARLQSTQTQQQSEAGQQPVPHFQTEFNLHFEFFPGKT